MKAAMYYNNRDVRLEEVPLPKIGAGELLMRVEASGICGTDLLEWYRVKKSPLVLGHEVAGVVVEAGEGVPRYKKGDRISVSHHVPCGSCHYCKRGHETVCDTLRKTRLDPGGFAEYVRIPAINVEKGVYPLPQELSFEEATFIEPLACALRGERLAQFRPKDTVLILGSGVAGLLHVQVAKKRGAGLVIATDIVEPRLEAAKRFGADFVMSSRDDLSARVKESNDGRLADIVILCTGAKGAIEQALQSVERGGTVLFFAAAEQGAVLPLPVNELFWRNETMLVSSYAAAPAEHVEAIGLIRGGSVCVKEMITHRLGLAQTELGFRLAANPREALKVIIEPQRL